MNNGVSQLKEEAATNNGFIEHKREAATSNGVTAPKEEAPLSNGVTEPKENGEEESVKVVVKSVRTKPIIDDKKIEPEVKDKPVASTTEQSSENGTSTGSNGTHHRSPCTLQAESNPTSKEDDNPALEKKSNNADPIENKAGDSQVINKENSSPIVSNHQSNNVKLSDANMSPAEEGTPLVTNGHDLVESSEPKSKPTSNDGGGYDYVFEAARSLGKQLHRQLLTNSSLVYCFSFYIVHNMMRYTLT